MNNKIQVSAYANSQSNIISDHAVLYDEASRTHIANLSDSVTVVISFVLNSTTIIDTLIVPPYTNIASNVIGSGSIPGEVPCTILSVTSKGGYQFSY